MPPADNATGGVASPKDLAAAALRAGFSSDGRLFDKNDPGAVTIVAIALAESGGDLNATHDNTKDVPPGKGIDRGPLQINDYWHPEVSDRCAFRLDCAMRAAYRISGGGRVFTQWTTYNSGAYKTHVETAKQAVAGWIAIDPGELKDPPLLDDVIGVVGNARDKIVSVADFLEALTKGETWVRVGEVVLGGALVGLGVYYMSK